ncbi:DUF4892 domain-containing protein [Teredinibacter turnerae]|uniref:DUF4892 domain-containing protein n=1 Tax=Teredinibacter turnerae TaxID=2426 RepID=UPI0030D181C7
MKLLLLIFIGCFSIFARAEPVFQFDGLFSGSRQMYAGTSNEPRYRFILSAPKKIDGRWQFDREEQVSAAVASRTYELAQSIRLRDAVAALDDYVRSLNARLLFLCDGLDCGSSNVWANEVFEVKQLYGLDQTQAYRAWELKVERGAAFLVAYLAQRGNGRLYAQVELLTIAGVDRLHLHASRASILNTLNAAGYYTLADVPEDVSALADALISRPTLTVYLVGHAYGREPLAVLVSRSQQLARQLKEKLEAQGVRATQLIAEGVGPLAPREDGSRVAHDRVEVVLR